MSVEFGPLALWGSELLMVVGLSSCHPGCSPSIMRSPKNSPPDAKYSPYIAIYTMGVCNIRV